MSKQIPDFNVGDYISYRDACWKVKSVTEQEYIITSVPLGLRQILFKGENPDKYMDRERYAENYHLLRPHDHADITNFPIGSVWKCSKEHGLNNPETDTVMVVSYALSEGVFWVCNTKRSSLTFIADKEDLISCV